MKSASIIALATSVSASGIFVRDVSAILSDITAIGTQVSGLTGTINNFKTLAADGQGLIAAEASLETAIKKGTSDAQALGSVSESEANSVLSAVKELIPSIVNALNAATNKNEVFVQQKISPIVADDLKSLQSETDAFAAALISKAPSAALPAASAAISCIDKAFSAARASPPVQASAACADDINVGSGGGGSGPPQGGSTTPGASPTSQTGPGSTSSGSAKPTSYSAQSNTPSSSAQSSPKPSSTAPTEYYTGDASSLTSNGIMAVIAMGLAFIF